MIFYFRTSSVKELSIITNLLVDFEREIHGNSTVSQFNLKMIFTINFFGLGVFPSKMLDLGLLKIRGEGECVLFLFLAPAKLYPNPFTIIV